VSPAKFAQQVEEEWAHLEDGLPPLTQEELTPVSQFFAPPAYEKLPDTMHVRKHLIDSKPFARWIERNVRPHKVPGYASVTLSA